MIEPTAQPIDSATRLDVQAALRRLTARQRTAVFLRAEGFTLAEIGSTLGTKKAAVSRLLGRAYERIRAEM